MKSTWEKSELLSNNFKKISVLDKEELENAISISEIKNAISYCKNDKAPELIVLPSKI